MHRVFYSFHYDNDVHRVQLIRNMGVVTGDEPVTKTAWEQLQRTKGIAKWIDTQMDRSDCVVVLVGFATAGRDWVKYEIRRAWETKKGLIGIYIDDLKCMVNGICLRGSNPFSEFTVNGRSLAEIVPCYAPPANDAYGNISRNLDGWVTTAVAAARHRS